MNTEGNDLAREQFWLDQADKHRDFRRYGVIGARVIDAMGAGWIVFDLIDGDPSLLLVVGVLGIVGGLSVEVTARSLGKEAETYVDRALGIPPELRPE